MLIWHNDPEQALWEQGYSQPNNVKYLPEEYREDIVIKHHIPLNIEQYFRHLCIETHIKKHDGTGTLHTLNFPGAIVTPNKKPLTGIFAIGFNPENNNEVYHRYFHIKNEEELQNTVRARKFALEIPEDANDQIVISLPETEEYIIEETPLMVSITDKFGITYILFKGHIL